MALRLGWLVTPLREATAASATSTSFFFQAEDGIRYFHVTGVQTCALPISGSHADRAKVVHAHDCSLCRPGYRVRPGIAGGAASGGVDSARLATSVSRNWPKRSLIVLGECGTSTVFVRSFAAISFNVSKYCVISTSCITSCAVAPATALEKSSMESFRPAMIALR